MFHGLCLDQMLRGFFDLLCNGFGTCHIMTCAAGSKKNIYTLQYIHLCTATILLYYIDDWVNTMNLITAGIHRLIWLCIMSNVISGVFKNFHGGGGRKFLSFKNH